MSGTMDDLPSSSDYQFRPKPNQLCECGQCGHVGRIRSCGHGPRIGFSGFGVSENGPVFCRLCLMSNAIRGTDRDAFDVSPAR